MNELALFAGAGGGILGGKLLGWRTVCAVEINPYARRVLLARQADGCLEPFPIWDDVTTFDGHQWRGRVDVVSGGFPCQDISAAGKGAGLNGARSGLWAEFARIISEVQPAYVWVENSPMLVVRGLDRVLWDLAAMGYDARWGIVGSDDVGFIHHRKRIWILANAGCESKQKTVEHGRQKRIGKRDEIRNLALSTSRRKPLPEVPRMDDGVAYGMDRLAAIGNGQVPSVVKLAWETLTGG